MAADDRLYDRYDDSVVIVSEMIFGAGNMSPGGPEGVRAIVEGLDLAGKTVLDIGCGPGTAALLAARHGIRVTGVDPAEPMLRLARLLTRLARPVGEIDWLRAGAEDLTVPDDSVTVCWSVASVHHWPDLSGGLSEVRRVLGSGGTFVALEKRTQPGATGNASHGWTPDQANAFATMLTDDGFRSAEVSNHDRGRRRVVAVTGRT